MLSRRLFAVPVAPYVYVYAGLLADRPASDLTIGSFYLTTDAGANAGKLYVATSSTTWEEKGSGGGGSSTAGWSRLFAVMGA
jgi:hypothetical protein